MTPMAMMAALAADNRRSRLGEGEPSLARLLGGFGAGGAAEAAYGSGAASGTSRAPGVTRDQHMNTGGGDVSSATAQWSGGYIVTSHAIIPR